MSATAAAELVGRTGRSSAPARLAVAWQHPKSRAIRPVGILTCAESGFDFRYLSSASQVDGFRPFLGFEDLTGVYRSSTLFPLFSQRIMGANRPDYAGYLATLGLATGADEWEVLSRSEGRRHGDEIRVFAEPAVFPDGSTEATFFVSGIRHRALEEVPGRVEAALSTLRAGCELRVVAQPENETDHRALLLVEASSVAVGWVPNVLLGYAHEVSDPTVTVLQVAGADAAPSYRLLVRLTGSVAPGFVPFSGAAWAVATDE